MAESEHRPRIGGYVSEEAYDGWVRFAPHQGVTVTALIEALGLVFADFVEDPSRMEAYDFREAVTEARLVVARRYSRRPRRPPGA